MTTRTDFKKVPRCSLTAVCLIQGLTGRRKTLSRGPVTGFSRATEIHFQDGDPDVPGTPSQTRDNVHVDRSPTRRETCTASASVTPTCRCPCFPRAGPGACQSFTPLLQRQ